MRTTQSHITVCAVRHSHDASMKQLVSNTYLFIIHSFIVFISHKTNTTPIEYCHSLHAINIQSAYVHQQECTSSIITVTYDSNFLFIILFGQ